MKDTRIIALERVVSRRKKLDKTLNAASLTLRSERGALGEKLAMKRAAVAEQNKVLIAQAKKIDAMMSGATGAFCAEDFLKQRDFQAALSEQQAGMLAQANQIAEQLSAKDAELAEMKTRIVVNRARISIYQDRRDGICAALEFAAEEAQDEEAAESRRSNNGG